MTRSIRRKGLQDGRTKKGALGAPGLDHGSGVRRGGGEPPGRLT